MNNEDLMGGINRSGSGKELYKRGKGIVESESESSLKIIILLNDIINHCFNGMINGKMNSITQPSIISRSGNLYHVIRFRS